MEKLKQATIILFCFIMLMLIAIIAYIIKKDQKESKSNDQYGSIWDLYWWLTKPKAKKTPPPQTQQPRRYSKKKLLTPTEIKFGNAIKKAIPQGYKVYPQICLASIINKENEHKYANELYRIIDFAIFDMDYNIKVLIEINDGTHHEKHRIARDYKVREICDVANIPLITLWTEYGIREDYIEKRIREYI